MAVGEPQIVETKLYSRRTENESLEQSISEFVKIFGSGFGVLYTPRSCFLAKLDTAGQLCASSGKEAAPEVLRQADLDIVFEARIFNSAAELRWLNSSNGLGPAVTLTETKESGEVVPNVYARIDPPNDYLLWGRSTGVTIDGWTQFAEARIGAFFVPLKDVPDQSYARFTAYEYLGVYEDGNVAVADERLTGIEIV